MATATSQTEPHIGRHLWKTAARRSSCRVSDDRRPSSAVVARLDRDAAFGSKTPCRLRPTALSRRNADGCSRTASIGHPSYRSFDLSPLSSCLGSVSAGSGGSDRRRSPPSLPSEWVGLHVSALHKKGRCSRIYLVLTWSVLLDCCCARRKITRSQQVNKSTLVANR